MFAASGFQPVILIEDRRYHCVYKAGRCSSSTNRSSPLHLKQKGRLACQCLYHPICCTLVHIPITTFLVITQLPSQTSCSSHRPRPQTLEQIVFAADQDPTNEGDGSDNYRPLKDPMPGIAHDGGNANGGDDGSGGEGATRSLGPFRNWCILAMILAVQGTLFHLGAMQEDDREECC